MFEGKGKDRRGIPGIPRKTSWARWLFYPTKPVPLLLIGLGLAVFLLLFFLVESGWAALGFAIPVNLYAYAVIGYLIYTLLYEYRQPRPRSPLVPLLEGTLIYIYLVVHNTILYAGIGLVQPDTFIGIRADFHRWQVLKNAFFLATETTAALGTGSIFSNPFPPAGISFLAVWINSVETVLLFTVIGPGLYNRVTKLHRRIRNQYKQRK
jgi:hypothetical protein